MNDNDKLSALPPNGVMIFLDRESGNWVLSANRFSVQTVTTDIRDSMLVEAVEMTGLEGTKSFHNYPRSVKRSVVRNHTARRLLPLRKQQN